MSTPWTSSAPPTAAQPSHDLTCGYAGGNTVHVDHHALAYVPGSSSTLIAGSDGGAYVTLNANAATPTFTRSTTA